MADHKTHPVVTWRTFNAESFDNILLLCLVAPQAALEQRAQEVSQEVVPQPAATPLIDTVATKLPVGKTSSSVHVDYNYFEVGTGQVSVLNIRG